MRPTSEFKAKVFSDAGFASLYGYENSDDSTCTKSRTGFLLNTSDCPVVWISRLQQDTALSILEAEINVLEHCCCELFPVLDMTINTGNVHVHEDNAGVFILAQTLPPQCTHGSKYYATKTA